MKRALIIAAHPDDDILGCGGLMSKYRNTVFFKIVYIGEGSTCRFKNPNSKNAIKEIKIRNSYAINALSILGIENYSFNNLPCGRFDQVPLIEINKIIENEILEFSPDTVFTHANCDSNQDHVKVHDATIIATRPGEKVKNVFSYEVLSSSEWGFKKAFNPNVFYKLSENNVDEKYESLKQFKSETQSYPHPRSKEGIYSNAVFRGVQSGNKFAEAFELIRQLN
jgi:LmbE family N-acetylglucosaminyl deacetylase